VKNAHINLQNNAGISFRSDDILAQVKIRDDQMASFCCTALKTGCSLSLCRALAGPDLWRWTVLSLFCSAPNTAAMTCDWSNRGNDGQAG
jgi:hypothetical protein